MSHFSETLGSFRCNVYDNVGLTTFTFQDASPGGVVPVGDTVPNLQLFRLYCSLREDAGFGKVFGPALSYRNMTHTFLIFP